MKYNKYFIRTDEFNNDALIISIAIKDFNQFYNSIYNKYPILKHLIKSR